MIERIPRRIPGVVGAIAGLMALAYLVVPASAPRAEIITAFATLSGDQEVPPVVTAASGVASFTVDTVADTFSFNMTVSMLSQAALFEPFTPAPALGPMHIHVAPPGVNGPIRLALIGGRADTADGFTQTIIDQALSPSLLGISLADFVDALKGGDTYVNIHTFANPGGEIRGQLVVPEPASAAILAAGLLALAGLGPRRRLKRG